MKSFSDAGAKAVWSPSSVEEAQSEDQFETQDRAPDNPLQPVGHIVGWEVEEEDDTVVEAI